EEERETTRGRKDQGGALVGRDTAGETDRPRSRIEHTGGRLDVHGTAPVLSLEVLEPLSAAPHETRPQLLMVPPEGQAVHAFRVLPDLERRDFRSRPGRRVHPVGDRV